MMVRRILFCCVLAVLAALVGTPVSWGQTPVYRQPCTTCVRPQLRTQPPPATYAPQTSSYPAPVQSSGFQSVSVQPSYGSHDATGFVAWLNAERAARGLAPVTHDAGIAAVAAGNNGPMSAARRSGHWYTGGFAQVAFYGPRSAIEAGQGFLRSPGHAALLLAPHVRSIGVAHDGTTAWTVNMR